MEEAVGWVTVMVSEVVARVEATVSWEAECSSNNNNGESSSSFLIFQRLEQH